MVNKLLFVLFLILTVVMLVQSIQIVVCHFDRLNDYGFGFLIGKVFLFLISGTLSYWLGKKIFASDS